MRKILRLFHVYEGEEQFQNLVLKIYACLIQCVNCWMYVQLGKGNFDPLFWKLVLPLLLVKAVLCRIGDTAPFIFDEDEEGTESVDEFGEPSRLSFYGPIIGFTLMNLIVVFML